MVKDTTDMKNMKSLKFNINYDNIHNLPPFVVLTKMGEILNSKKIVNYNIVMKELDSSKLDNILNDFFSNMFNKDYDKFIKLLERKTFVSDKIDMPITTVLYDRVGNPINFNVLLKKYKTIEDATIAIHEYTHALIYKNLPSYNFPYHYNELFPYLFRTIAVEENSSCYDSFSYYDAHQSNQMWLLKNDINNYFNNLKEKDKNKRLYQEHRIYSYIVADVYSSLLFEDYKSDPDKMKHFINRVFSNKMSINSFLDYYDVTMDDRAVENIKQKTLTLKY